MNIVVANIIIPILVIIMIILCILLLLTIIILLSYCNFSIFLFTSFDNFYYKISVSYLYSILQLDIIFHERLYIKFVNKLNLFKYNAIFVQKNKKIEDISNNNDINNENKIDIDSIEFEKCENLNKDYIREEKEYIKNFNSNKTKDLSNSVKNNIIDFKNNIISNKEKISDFINKYLSNKAFEFYKFLATQLKEIFQSIKFSEFNVKIEFGLEDNYYMSKLLIFFSFFYTMFKDFNAKPIYNENVFRGYINLKGKFNLIGFVKPIFKLLCNKEFIKLLKDLFGEIKLWKMQKKKITN